MPDKNKYTMKKVILNNQEQQTINLNELNDSHIIGIEWNNGDKSQVVKFDEATYIGVEPGRINSSYSSKVVYNTIQDICGERTVKQALTFDNRKEFIKWLAEED